MKINKFLSLFLIICISPIFLIQSLQLHTNHHLINHGTNIRKISKLFMSTVDEVDTKVAQIPLKIAIAGAGVGGMYIAEDLSPHI